MTYSIQQPFIFSIFGASGDLAKIKIFPALYELASQKKLPDDFYIVGYARTKMERDQFQKVFLENVREHIKTEVDDKILKNLLDHVYYFSGQYDVLDDFEKFARFLGELTEDRPLLQIAYFSVPSFVFQNIIENLAKTKRNHDIRLILEKPFGSDAQSATDLFHFVARYFDDDQVYLLDHYLGKAAVQSIYHLRHANSVLNMLLKGSEIANIQITAAESMGVKERGGYFDQFGTIKDMIQSHLLQLLASVAMSIPVSKTARSFHRERQNVLEALSFPAFEKNVILGQYQGYLQEKGIGSDSRTETFAALRLFIDHEEWYNVPIYIRTGKMLKRKHTYISIEFKKFAFQSSAEGNRLVLELAPNEVISLTLLNKYGVVEEMQDLILSHSFACETEGCLAEHSLLLLDVIRGNTINFLSFPEIIACWEVIDRVAEVIDRYQMEPASYLPGSDGPDQQHQLTSRDGFRWF